MTSSRLLFFFFFFNDTATTEIYTLSLHDALPICALPHPHARLASGRWLALAGRESNPLDSIEKFPSADRKSTRLNSSHSQISYAVFCLKKKKKKLSPASRHPTTYDSSLTAAGTTC